MTDEGSAFYEAAVRALAALDQALSAVDSDSEAQGLLRVTMPLTLAESRVIGFIGQFLEQYPKVQVDLSISDHAVHLVADHIDVALRVGRLVDSGLIARKLGVAKRVLVASPAYLERHGRPKTAADLSKHNCLAYSLLSAGPSWRFTTGEEVKIMGNFRADSPNALKAAALSGIGIIANAIWLFERELASGALEQVLPHLEPEPMPIHAVLPSGRYVAARTRVFIEFMATAFARDPLLAM